MKRGALIVFEGLDGSGKSTQIGRLARRLQAAGHRVVETREPYDCAAGRRIRAMARSGEPVPAEQELAWFLEQRTEHVREVIVPALEQGALVLCDRYFLSTVAYQGARGLDPQQLLAESERDFPVPDLVVVLEIEPDQGLRRVEQRGEPSEPVFEERAFQERVGAIFASLDRDYLARVDGARGPDEVEEAVASVLSERLGLL